LEGPISTGYGEALSIWAKFNAENPALSSVILGQGLSDIVPNSHSSIFSASDDPLLIAAEIDGGNPTGMCLPLPDRCSRKGPESHSAIGGSGG
jgi:hypothetical protein